MGKRDDLLADIESALDPGRFVGDRGCFSFVNDLEAVEKRIAALVARDPARAVSIPACAATG